MIWLQGDLADSRCPSNSNCHLVRYVFYTITIMFLIVEIYGLDQAQLASWLQCATLVVSHTDRWMDTLFFAFQHLILPHKQETKGILKVEAHNKSRKCPI